MKYLVLILLLAFAFIIATKFKTENGPFHVQAIDSEFNQRKEFNFKYFEVSNHASLKPNELIQNIKNFTHQNSSGIQISNETTLFFYQKNSMINYQGLVQSAAEQNEFGGIEGHEKELISKIIYKIIDGKTHQSILIYKDGKLITKSEFEEY